MFFESYLFFLEIEKKLIDRLWKKKIKIFHLKTISVTWLLIFKTCAPSCLVCGQQKKTQTLGLHIKYKTLSR